MMSRSSFSGCPPRRNDRDIARQAAHLPVVRASAEAVLRLRHKLLLAGRLTRLSRSFAQRKKREADSGEADEHAK